MAKINADFMNLENTLHEFEKLERFTDKQRSNIPYRERIKNGLYNRRVERMDALAVRIKKLTKQNEEDPRATS